MYSPQAGGRACPAPSLGWGSTCPQPPGAVEWTAHRSQGCGPDRGGKEGDRGKGGEREGGRREGGRERGKKDMANLLYSTQNILGM